jgi:CHAD domain-containing protein
VTFEPERTQAVRERAYEHSQSPESGSAEENWLRAERELAVSYEYDTSERDLERLGMSLVRLPLEAGAVWRLTLPRGELVEGWEPGTHGLDPPDEIASLLDVAVGSKPLLPAPPASTDPGAVRLREMLAAQRHALLAHDPGVRVGADPENLHQHRVAARRARAFVRATRASLDAVWAAALAARLRDLGAVTGPVRDLDVLLERLAVELRSLGEADAPAADLLVAKLRRERDALRERLLDALNDADYRRLLAQLHAPPRLSDGVETVPLDRIARKELRRLTTAVKRLGDAPDETAIHGLRILLKRVRYSAELAAPEGKPLRRFLATARALQDLLGEHQDAAVAERHLRAAAVVDAPTAVAFVAGRIAERQQMRRAAVRASLPAAWKRLRKRGKAL